MVSDSRRRRRAQSPAEPTRLDSLTALRFFAALFVVIFHGFYVFTGREGLEGAGFVNFGYTSVGFFFVLSGFVLAWSWRPGTAFYVLWWRRVARVVPLCALLTSVVAVYYVAVPKSAPPGMVSWGSYAHAMLLLQSWPPFTYLLSYNYPSWSLSTELFFYLCFPFVVLAAARLPRRVLVPLALVLAAVYIWLGHWIVGQNIYSYTPGSLLAYPPLQLVKFTAGVLLGTAFRRGWRPRLHLGFALALLVVLYAAMPHLVTAEGPLATFRPTELFPDDVLLLPMMLLVCAAASSDLRGRLLVPGRLRPLVVLGDWSFALYLVHAPVLMLVNELRVRTEHLAPPGAVWFAVFALVCVALSGLLHTAFEKPVERLLRPLVGPRRAAQPEVRNPSSTSVATTGR